MNQSVEKAGIGLLEEAKNKTIIPFFTFPSIIFVGILDSPPTTLTSKEHRYVASVSRKEKSWLMKESRTKQACTTVYSELSPLDWEELTPAVIDTQRRYTTDQNT